MGKELLDFCFPNCSGIQIIGILISSLLVGVNKSGIPGLGMLPVVLLSMIFDRAPGLASGLMLLLICLGDYFAVGIHWRSADWKIIRRLLPFSILGILLGNAALRVTGIDNLSILTGFVLLGLMSVHIIQAAKFWERDLFKQTVPYVTGLFAGFTSQIANAAGPVIALYLLREKLSKTNYVGTCAWFFMIMNAIKLPIFIGEGRVTMEAVHLLFPSIPFLIAGSVLGIFFLRNVQQRAFEIIVEIIVALCSVKLIMPLFIPNA